MIKKGAPLTVTAHLKKISKLFSILFSWKDCFSLVVPLFDDLLDPFPAFFKFFGQFRFTFELRKVAFSHLYEMSNKISWFFQLPSNLLLEPIKGRLLSMSIIMRACLGLSSITVFLIDNFITFIFCHFWVIGRKGKFIIFADGVSLWLLIFDKKHMLEISYLFSILPELYILQILYLFLSKNQLIFALLISYGQLFLEMFHLLNKSLFIFESFLKDHVLFSFSLQIELQQ